MNLKFDYKNQIVGLQTDGVKSCYVPVSETKEEDKEIEKKKENKLNKKVLERPPMMALGIKTTTRQMRGTLQIQVHPTSDNCIVLFGVPPTIPGTYII